MQIITAKRQANTNDIMQALYNVAPAAAHQMKMLSSAEILQEYTGEPVSTARNFAAWINKNIQYQADGYQYQRIILPEKLLITKKGDCKSFSLLMLAALSYYGFRNGLRFASYRENKTPTHVYNFVIDEKGNKFTFDSCVSTLKESNKATYIKDMEVQYLAGLPVMINSPENEFIGRGRFLQGVKKVTLAPGRGAFLTLVNLNFRGFASRLSKVKNPAKLKDLWNKLGGNFDKLQNAIRKGATKRPLFGGRVNGFEDGQYIGIDPATAAAIAAAAPIVLAVVNFLKKEGVPEIPGDVPPGTEPLNTGAGFVATDPDPGVRPTPVAATGTASTGFQINPIILMGGAAVLFLLLNKKR
jgi:hypothetical protein